MSNKTENGHLDDKTNQAFPLLVLHIEIFDVMCSFYFILKTPPSQAVLFIQNVICNI